MNKVGKLSGAKGRSGIVVVTWANYHYRDFVLNWVEHLNFTGCRSFLVGERRSALGSNISVACRLVDFAPSPS